MPPSETFVALQGLAKRRREDPPGTPRGPGPAPASEPRGASSASETLYVPTGTGSIVGASLEDPAVDEPSRLAAITAGALAHLPRFEDVVERYRLFRGDEKDAETGRRCEPVMNPEGSGVGEMTCLCRDCRLWRRVVGGSANDYPFWVARKQQKTHETTTENTSCVSERTHVKPMYEVFTREHVSGLADYFRKRAVEWLGADMKTRSLRVLELGAGSGVLRRSLAAATRALDEADLQENDSVTYHATDDYSFLAKRRRDDKKRNDEKKKNVKDVRAMDYKDALRDSSICDGFPPDFVLICWHPIRTDWTAEVRRVASVLEYVLVGEADFGACGHPVETWGLRLRDDYAFSEGDEELGDGDATVPSGNAFSPPHEADGFERMDLDALSKHQVCRTDEPWLKARRSKTVSFRRRRAL